MARLLIWIDDVVNWEVMQPREQGDSYVAVCQQLGLSIEAKTRDELETLARDVLDELGKDLETHNDAFEFLTAHGIRFRVEPVKQVSPTSFAVPAPSIRLQQGAALSAQ